jgi:hypothetical protein
MNGLMTEVIEDHIRCASIRPTTPSWGVLAAAVMAYKVSGSFEMAANNATSGFATSV